MQVGIDTEGSEDGTEFKEKREKDEDRNSGGTIDSDISEDEGQTLFRKYFLQTMLSN